MSEHLDFSLIPDEIAVPSTNYVTQINANVFGYNY